MKRSLVCSISRVLACVVMIMMFMYLQACTATRTISVSGLTMTDSGGVRDSVAVTFVIKESYKGTAQRLP